MLSILIWLPLAAALIGALLPRRVGPRVALLGALGTLGLSIYLLVDFNVGGGLQHVTDELWISSLGIHYKLGIDGLNILLIVLTAFVFAGAVLAANLREWDRPRTFYFQLALAESGVLGAFCAQDLALFVMFFDVMLIPFYFLIGTWGGRDSIAATRKLVIYTLVGSLFMLVAAVATGVLTASDADAPLSFAFTDLARNILDSGEQYWLFLFFAFAFIVKMPLFPFHGWMPDGYRAMPIPVLMAFGAVLAKVASYGFLKITLPLFPDAAVHFQTLLLVIAIVAIIYGSIMAFTQRNVRLIVGYSSMAQMGFITLGIFSLQPEGSQGAIFQMVNHAIVAAPLFFILALVAARSGDSEDLNDMGGVATKAPVLAALFLIVSLATLAMPGSPNFVGEFFILLGVFDEKMVFSIIAFSGVVFASVYMLRAYIRMMHNERGPKVTEGRREMSFADGLVIVPFVLVLLALALYPQYALDRSERAAEVALVRTERVQNPPPRRPASQLGQIPQQGAQQLPQQGGAQQVPQGATP
jgi:NADH-quinone oxidoreductase subunit M